MIILQSFVIPGQHPDPGNIAVRFAGARIGTGAMGKPETAFSSSLAMSISGVRALQVRKNIFSTGPGMIIPQSFIIRKNFLNQAILSSVW
jgi:hypothetical protein